jgi:hypothetical protein
MFGKVLEYGYVALSYLKGPFSYAVNFAATKPRTTVAIFIGTHVARFFL